MTARDFDTFASVLSEDFRLWFGTKDGPGIDREGMRSIFEWDRACNPKYECSDFLVNGYRATVLMREENDFTRLLDFAGWETKLELRFTGDGKIKEELVILLGSGPSFEEKLQPALDWLGAHYPDDLADIYPNDQFVFSGENARRWIWLLRDWRRATNRPIAD